MTGDLTLCFECGLCCVFHTAGFISETYYTCAQWGVMVDPDDACTFGTPGQPQNSTEYDSITLDTAEVFVEEYDIDI